MFLMVLGLFIGLGIALASGRLLSRLLYQVSASEPLTYLGVGSLLVMVALLACYHPAGRASRMDPWLALRHE